MDGSDLAMAFFTGALAVTGVIGVVIYNEQLKAMNEQREIMQRQLNVMENDQRPWVKLEITGLRTLQFTQDGAQIGVDYVIKNIGHSPANKVWVDFSFFPMAQNKYPHTEQTLVCNKMRAQEQPTPMMSRTLFPDESFAMAMTIRMTKADISEALKGRPIDQPKIIAPYIVGCVEYRSGGDQRRHQTPFVFEVRRTTAPHYIPIDGGDVPAAELSADNYLQMVDASPD